MRSPLPPALAFQRWSTIGLWLAYPATSLAHTPLLQTKYELEIRCCPAWYAVGKLGFKKPQEGTIAVVEPPRREECCHEWESHQHCQREMLWWQHHHWKQEKARGEGRSALTALAGAPWMQDGDMRESCFASFGANTMDARKRGGERETPQMLKVREGCLDWFGGQAPWTQERETWRKAALVETPWMQEREGKRERERERERVTTDAEGEGRLLWLLWWKHHQCKRETWRWRKAALVETLWMQERDRDRHRDRDVTDAAGEGRLMSLLWRQRHGCERERDTKLKEGCFGGNTMDARERDITDAEGEGRLLWWKHRGCNARDIGDAEGEGRLLRWNPPSQGNIQKPKETPAEIRGNWFSEFWWSSSGWARLVGEVSTIIGKVTPHKHFNGTICLPLLCGEAKPYWWQTQARWTATFTVHPKFMGSNFRNIQKGMCMEGGLGEVVLSKKMARNLWTQNKGRCWGLVESLPLILAPIIWEPPKNRSQRPAT